MPLLNRTVEESTNFLLDVKQIGQLHSQYFEAPILLQSKNDGCLWEVCGLIAEENGTGELHMQTVVVRPHGGAQTNSLSLSVNELIDGETSFDILGIGSIRQREVSVSES